MFEFAIFVVIPLITAGLCYLIKDLRIQFGTSLVVASFHLGLSLVVFLGFIDVKLPTYFSADSLSKLFLLILSNVYFWVVLVSYSYLKRPVVQRAEEGKKLYFV